MLDIRNIGFSGTHTITARTSTMAVIGKLP